MWAPHLGCHSERSVAESKKLLFVQLLRLGWVWLCYPNWAGSNNIAAEAQSPTGMLGRSNALNILFFCATAHLTAFFGYTGDELLQTEGLDSKSLN
jgi:hypothetical protein